jgi:hypothetical protein
MAEYIETNCPCKKQAVGNLALLSFPFIYSVFLFIPAARAIRPSFSR